MLNSYEMDKHGCTYDFVDERPEILDIEVYSDDERGEFFFNFPIPEDSMILLDFHRRTKSMSMADFKKYYEGYYSLNKYSLTKEASLWDLMLLERDTREYPRS